ncbi:MAG: peptidase M75 [Synechococcaceae cyanobacterium SM2_3_1]|nr:peptidase M75 [Synechococcaceae cyanobacterium SM2_3_1]
MHLKRKIWTSVGAFVVVGAGLVYIPAITQTSAQSQLLPQADPLTAVEVAPSTLLFAQGGEGSEMIPNTDEMEDVATGQAIVTHFVDQVIIPTYEQLTQKASTMADAVIAFADQPTEKTLQTARQSWISARDPWEQSEAFAFGPAASLGYDADLDDWPVNETDVIAVLNSDQPLTRATIAELQTTQKGYHTIEFLLFGLNNNKTLSEFTERELEYLRALAIHFEDTASALLASWVEGVEGNPPYRQVLVTAGEVDNPAYLTVRSSVVELVAGMIALLDEVANEKLGDPLSTQETFGFESRFSQTSLDDFRNNLLSVQSVYMAKLPDETGSGDTSLSRYIASQNPELDQQFQQKLQAAIAAIEAVPAPIEATLSDSEAFAQLSQAQIAVLDLLKTVEDEILPMVQS